MPVNSKTNPRSVGAFLARARENWSVCQGPSANSATMRTEEPYTASFGGHSGFSTRRLNQAIDVRRVVQRNDRTGYLVPWFFSENRPAWSSIPVRAQGKLKADIRSARRDIVLTLGGERGGYNVG